jgi:hypothetical protein
MTPQLRLGVATVAGLGVLVFALLLFGGLGGPRPALDPMFVDEVRAGPRDPADRFGAAELRIVGWYAELAGDCRGDPVGGGDASVAWLQRECPLRVLLAEQPPAGATQAELERDGIRLAASTGAPFPSRAEPSGPNLRLQQLVFTGHFDDPAAASCSPELVERCRNTFVVSDYDGFVR